MRSLGKWIFVFVVLSLPLACKSKPSSTGDNPIDNNPATNLEAAQADAERYLASLGDEHLVYDAEFKKVKIATSEYRSSDLYKNPQNDSQRLLNITADITAGLSPETIQPFILQKRIAMFEEAFLGLQDYKDQIQHIMNETASFATKSSQPGAVPVPQAITATPDSVTASMPSVTPSVQTLVETTTLTVLASSTQAETSSATTTATDATQESAIKRTLLIATGICVIAFTAFGIFEVGHRSKEIAKMGWSEYKTSFVKNSFRDSALYLKVAYLTFVSGVIIESLATTGTVNGPTLRDPLFIVGALASMLAFYWVVEGAANAARGLKNIGITDKEGHYIDSEGNLRNKLKQIIRDLEDNFHLDEDGKIKVNAEGKFLGIDGKEIVIDLGKDGPVKDGQGAEVAKVENGALKDTKNTVLIDKEGNLTIHGENLGVYKEHKIQNLQFQEPAYNPKKYYHLDVLASVSGDRGGQDVWAEGSTTRGKGIAISFAKAFGASILATGAAVGYVGFDLAEKALPADEKYLAAIKRFWGVCSLLSEQGKLARN